MKICFLTQTAYDISDDYKSFFRDKNLFFITFKAPNPNALAYLPKSSWSDGRNKLWDLVKGKYDYYVFIDDDLKFFNFDKRFSSFPILAYLYNRFRIKNIYSFYRQSKPQYFFSKLEYYLEKYKPEVASVTQTSWDPNSGLDELAMRHNSFVRRMAYFDAQFTVMSNYAAFKIMPYDTKLSGWWSAQIPVYLYTYHVFASKAINISELGVTNNFHVGAYVPNYDGLIDCRNMIAEISKATNKDYSALAGKAEAETVDFHYGVQVMRDKIAKVSVNEDYEFNYNKSLKGLENFWHQSIGF